MTDALFATDESNTALSPEEQLDLIPSLSTRAELNEAERANIHAARVWASLRLFPVFDSQCWHAFELADVASNRPHPIQFKDLNEAFL